MYESEHVDPFNFRIGIGHDTHRLVAGGQLKIGGVEIPHNHSLNGHSDADILLHAATDAILGAAALGDIGELFPDNDDTNKNRDSIEFLAAANEKVHAAGFQIINLDCIVFAQSPKLSLYKRSMARRIADCLQIDELRVGIKAKTGERVGPVGLGQAMQAQVVALLVQVNPPSK